MVILDTHEFDPLVSIHSCDSIPELLQHSNAMYGSIDASNLIKKSDVCYFGCGVTNGLHVDSQHLWTNILDQMLGWRSNNLALPSMDVESICNMFVAASRLIEFKIAIVLLPDWYRTLMPLQKDHYVTYALLQPDLPVLPHGYEFEARFAAENLFAMEDEYFIDRYRTNLQRMRYIASIKNIELLVSTWVPKTVGVLNSSGCRLIDPMANDHLGYDNKHPGKDCHTAFAHIAARAFT